MTVILRLERWCMFFNKKEKKIIMVIIVEPYNVLFFTLMFILIIKLSFYIQLNIKKKNSAECKGSGNV